MPRMTYSTSSSPMKSLAHPVSCKREKCALVMADTESIDLQAWSCLMVLGPVVGFCGEWLGNSFIAKILLELLVSVFMLLSKQVERND